jgi:hypothetical protein
LKELSMAITVAMRTQVSQLYVSLFGRAPDGEGLGFWVNALDSGKTIAQVAQEMYATAPARAYYPAFATNGEIIATFYQNVLGRAADAEGLAFWTAELNTAATKGEVFAKLINNVVNYTGTDANGLKSQSLLKNKVEVAQYYGEKNGTVAGATAVLAGVTEVASTVTAAKAIADGASAAGQTFTLTTGVDQGAAFIGGAGNDTFNATPNAGAQTFTALDNIDGGAGTGDTLNIVAGAAYTAPIAVTVKNIETVNLTNTTGGTTFSTAAAAGFTGVSNLNVTNAAGAATITAAGTTSVSVTNATPGAATTVNGGSSVSVAVTGADATPSGAEFGAAAWADDAIYGGFVTKFHKQNSSVPIQDDPAREGTITSIMDSKC